ncbi:MAG: hypothetical protein HQL48_02630 [Gammaproteobacteria bacterium]|nr:hypothetical protein [Gammaproteobacteria bacterium]
MTVARFWVSNIAPMNLQATLSQRSHLFVFVLLTSLVLGQLFLILHQIEHVVAADDHSCLICELASHQADALIATFPALIPTTIYGTRIEYRYSFSNIHTSHYLSRAPPSPLPI